jgi:hypothetical protein
MAQQIFSTLLGSEVLIATFSDEIVRYVPFTQNLHVLEINQLCMEHEME